MSGSGKSGPWLGKEQGTKRDDPLDYKMVGGTYLMGGTGQSKFAVLMFKGVALLGNIQMLP